MKYKTVPGKGVTLRNVSVKVSDDGRFMGLDILGTPFPNLAAEDASDLFEVLGDVLHWANDEDDIKN